MALSHRLELKHTQSLVLTPQVQLTLKLMKLSNLELSEYVEEELRENPLVERREQDDDAAQEPLNGAASDTAAPDPEDASNPRDSMELATSESLPADSDSPLDTDYENFWDSGAPAGGASAFGTPSAGAGGRSDFSEFSPDIEATLSQQTTLRDHLQGQIAVDFTDPGDRLIGLYLIEMLTEAGYLDGGLDDMAEKLGCPTAKVEAVLERLQRFDPPGIFARSAAECFALQLRERDRLDPAMQALLDNLKLLGERKFKALEKICGVDIEDIQDMEAEILTLKRAPAEDFIHEIAQTLVPDILMRGLPEGGWHFELNPDTLPRILVNRQYHARISSEARNPEEQKYLNEKLQSANWLMNALDQRQKTILKVATEIVCQQDAFFRYGVSHMRPLVLRDIAEVVKVHESTVSRVTSNKYMATPRGIFELKYFFTAALSSTEGGSTHSAESVRHRIKELCNDEPPDSILSDDDIVTALRDHGIDIARRTVAKYRCTMNIPSSVERRRRKGPPK